MFSKLPTHEIERRRIASIEAMKERDREDFEDWYQEQCDRLYWARGQCCAGCDHWSSSGGYSGRCAAAGIVSGADVLRSMGVEFSSYMPAPGFPFSEAHFHCGCFKDDFDWSTLPDDYLDSIGARRNGVLKSKHTHAAPCGA